MKASARLAIGISPKELSREGRHGFRSPKPGVKRDPRLRLITGLCRTVSRALPRWS